MHMYIRTSLSVSVWLISVVIITGNDWGVGRHASLVQVIEVGDGRIVKVVRVVPV